MGTTAQLREAVQTPAKKPTPAISPASGERQQPDPHQRRKWRNLFRYASGQIDPEIHNDDEANKAPVTRGSLKRFFEFVKPHKGLVLLLSICTLVNQAMIVVMPVAIGRVIDKVLPQRDMALLNYVAIGLAFFLFAR